MRGGVGRQAAREERAASSPRLRRDRAGAAEPLPAVPLPGASAQRLGNSGTRAGAGRETPHPPSLPRGWLCAAAETGPPHRGPGGGGGRGEAAEVGPGERCP